MNRINWLWWWRVRSLSVSLSLFFDFIEFCKAEFQPQVSRMVGDIQQIDSRDSNHYQFTITLKALEDFAWLFYVQFYRKLFVLQSKMLLSWVRARARVKWTNQYNERYSSKFGIPHLWACKHFKYLTFTVAIDLWFKLKFLCGRKRMGQNPKHSWNMKLLWISEFNQRKIEISEATNQMNSNNKEYCVV